MKKLLISVLTLGALTSFAQTTMVRLESYSIQGETVSFEGTDLNTNEKVVTNPMPLMSLGNNGNNVRYWLFEGCYKYEMASARAIGIPARPVTGYDAVSMPSNANASNGNSFITPESGEKDLTATAEGGYQVLENKSPKLVELLSAKEWVRPCPSHPDVK